MPRIITNIFKKLTEPEKKEIKKLSEEFGDVEFFELTQKEPDLKDSIKFILDNFNIKKIIENISLLDSFKSLLQKLLLISENKSEIPIEIQFWFKDTLNPAALNIAFAVKEVAELRNMIDSLKNKLITDIFSVHKELSGDKIIWIGFDKENNSCKIQFK